MDEMKADEILDKGAEKIVGGWCKQAFGGQVANEDGGVSDVYCAMGAMRQVAFGHYTHVPGQRRPPDNVGTEYLKAEAALAEVMLEQFGIPPVIPFFQAAGRPETAFQHYTLSPWDIIAKGNDEFAQTKEEVVACMEKAAVNLRSARDQ